MYIYDLTIFFTLLAFILFAFVYWKDATSEGFGSDKIMDSFFLILISAILGGKLLFRPISIDYLRFQILDSPLILEGALVAGAFCAYLIIKKNKWEGLKIGDMFAPALAVFQAVFFFGFYLRTKALSHLLIFLGFIVLYLFIRFLKYKKHFGSSKRYFELRRANHPVFTGALFVAYLTGSSLIAMLFLFYYFNFHSWFWYFQLVFYFSALVFSYILYKKRHKRK